MNKIHHLTTLIIKDTIKLTQTTYINQSFQNIIFVLGQIYFQCVTFPLFIQFYRNISSLVFLL